MTGLPTGLVTGLLAAMSGSGKETVGGAGVVADSGEVSEVVGGAMLMNPCKRLNSYERIIVSLSVPLGGRRRCRSHPERGRLRHRAVTSR